MADFKSAWLKVDPRATNLIPQEALLLLMQSLPPPLGFEGQEQDAEATVGSPRSPSVRLSGQQVVVEAVFEKYGLAVRDGKINFNETLIALGKWGGVVRKTTVELPDSTKRELRMTELRVVNSKRAAGAIIESEIKAAFDLLDEDGSETLDPAEVEQVRNARQRAPPVPKRWHVGRLDSVDDLFGAAVALV